MKNWHNHSLLLSDKQIEIFYEIEKRGLQFIIPKEYKSMYDKFLKIKKKEKGL